MSSTEHALLDFEASSEPISDEQLNTYLNFLANHETKLLLMAILALPGRVGKGFSADKLREDIVLLQRPFLSWNRPKDYVSIHKKSKGWPDIDSSAVGSLMDGLAKVGLVEASLSKGANGKPTTKYSIPTEEEAQRALALTGALMTWSLYYEKELSLQQLLGATWSHSSSSKRPPETRYAVLSAITRHQDGIIESALKGDLKKRGFSSSSQVKYGIDSLVGSGFVQRASGPKGSRSRSLNISSGYSMPVRHLRQDLDLFRRDPTNQQFIDDALTFMRNSESVARLMAKAKEHTPAANRNGTRLNEIGPSVLALLSSKGSGMTVTEAHLRLKEELGIDVGKTTLTKILGAFVTSGQARSGKVKIGRNKPVHYQRLPEN